ncbi:hypothetical protein [Nitrosomonas sp. Nm166]|uniref:hypothetical protein n=1 Tax=Nitrosomonas sp. Nm166 TaxID=1881054 RepID=UPI0008E25494|nr:hypothetical protein [Nitrosomonas sp. Nm166]SFE64238.1 hypothetical protein SAMN05428977_102343 [Nitrosomonas sp. Nm166]
MMTLQAKTARNLEEIIPSMNSILEDDELVKDNDKLIENDDELLENDEELFIEEENDKNKIPEELTKKYFETLNSSVLPF